MNIGERIEKLREQKGWIQKELAEKVGYNESVMNRIESGKRPLKDTELKMFADLFDVSVDYLLGRTDKKEINEDKEFQEFINDPELDHFFRDMKDSPREQVEELKKIWNIIKQREE